MGTQKLIGDAVVCVRCGHTEGVTAPPPHTLPTHREIYHSKDADIAGGVRHSAVPIPGVEYIRCTGCEHYTDSRLV